MLFRCYAISKHNAKMNEVAFANLLIKELKYNRTEQIS